MKIIISNASSEPIYQQIGQQIKAQIISGDLNEGDGLPSIRKLAKELHISVITTKRTYEELEKEGFIDVVGGKGTFVAIQNKELLREKKMKSIEDMMAETVTEAQKLGITFEELQEMLGILYNDNNE
ncbi:MAG: GntR family transcriptional regulator [Ulvibacter sp.]|jgi:GntR family transcriptional regulator